MPKCYPPDVLDWVRVTIVDPDRRLADCRDVEDAWYAGGGYRPPEEQQQAREELATAELHEWLDRHQPRPGSYVIKVSELDPMTNAIGRTWATVRSVHYGPAATKPSAVA